MSHTRSLLLSLSVAAGGATGCAEAPMPVRAASDLPPAGESRVPMRIGYVPPVRVDRFDEAVVRVSHPDTSCSGTLIEQDLVLTAHHCVASRGPRGEFLSSLVDPKSLRIELGGDHFAWDEVRIRAVIAPPCGERGGDGDVAVLVLSRKLVGFPTAKLLLDHSPERGETVDPIGFGRCAYSRGPSHRYLREGGPIDEVRGGAFRLQAAVCPGDSGGPAVQRGTMRVLGVVSMSAMDADENTRSTSIFSRIDRFRNVVSHARMIADGTSASELPPLSCE
ncbi:MAG: trypsin-like serine protease [Polyangiaceae bacterium]|nr:trypsin-like serine protease [Polyangiaceae bacterium]